MTTYLLAASISITNQLNVQARKSPISHICETYSKTMALLLFGRTPRMETGSVFRCNRLFFHLCCRTL